MVENCCPVPLKKLRILLSSDSSENEELNLSPSFDEIYHNLMKDEMIAICLKQYNSTDSLTAPNKLSEFLRKCDELQLWIETVWCQNKKQRLCRSDYYLEKICHSRQLLQSSRFVNLKMLGKVLISREPHLQETIATKIRDIEHQWHSNGLFTDLTIGRVLDDIDEDIGDLFVWLNNTRQKLNFDPNSTNRKRDIELIEYILRDFDIHNGIGLTVTKVINELLELGSSYYDRIIISKSNMDSVEGNMYQQWLNAIECKMKIENENREVSNILYTPIGMIAQESGFESELSPMYNVRKQPKMSNKQPMKYISSGDDLSGCTTALPSDTESADIPINFVTLSSSTLYSSTETMPEFSQIKDILKENDISQKRIIRRKKRRSKRSDKRCQNNLSTEESETCLKNNDKYCLKRRNSEASNTQLTESQLYSPLGLNYSEIANVAEILVRKNSYRSEYSAHESPKESEIEDIIDTAKSSLNDIDVDKNWDYYQASMYSNEDGDSEIIEVDTINDWEPEIDSDGAAILMDCDNSPKTSVKRLSNMTSGYETTMETDPIICAKSLICVLQFTTNYYREVDKKINAVADTLVQATLSSFHSVLRVITDCDSTAQMHLKLLRHILNYDPCSVTHNTTLIDNLRIMETRWERIKDKCYNSRLNAIDNRMMSLDNYRNVEELKLVLDSLQELETIVRCTRIGVNRAHSGEMERLLEVVDDMEMRVANAKEVRTKELELVLNALACVAQSKCTRRLFASELRLSKEDGACTNVDVRDIYDKFEKCIISLKKCMENMSTILSAECQTQVSTTIENEIRAWNKLCDGVNHISPLSCMTTEQLQLLQSSVNHHQTIVNNPTLRRRLLNHVPMHMAIIVVVAMIGWWYNQSLDSDCHSSSASDWLQLFYRYKDRMEPH